MCFLTLFSFHRKELSETETLIRQQQNLYQAARNDRTGLNKSLTEAHDEISDLKGKLRVLQHQFDQLKEEMVTKETAILKATHENQKTIKEKEELNAEGNLSIKVIVQRGEYIIMVGFLIYFLYIRRR